MAAGPSSAAPFARDALLGPTADEPLLLAKLIALEKSLQSTGEELIENHLCVRRRASALHTSAGGALTSDAR